MKTWKCKDGTVRYELAACDTCGKRSNTTVKETAQNSFTWGWTCRECISKAKPNKSIFRRFLDWIDSLAKFN